MIAHSYGAPAAVHLLKVEPEALLRARARARAGAGARARARARARL